MVRRRREGEPASQPVMLGELVATMLPELPAEEWKLVRALRAWQRVVPERVNKNARPVRLREGRLTVHCTTSAWSQELTFLLGDITTQMRLRVPEIREIRARVGPMPEVPVRERHKPRPPPIPLRDVPEDLARELVHVHDDDLRDAITRAALVALGKKT